MSEPDIFRQETEHIAEDNLGIRQHALNTRVNEAAANQVHFNDVRDTAETSDLDRLFKIDLAAKYKHTDYIFQTLKSGDSLYITRAINKSLWLYDAEHMDVINPDYLHHNIFPFMPIKMMKKFLTAISNHVRDEERATEFFHYCMKNKLNNEGFKFFLFTNEEFRRALLLDHTHEYFTYLTKKDVRYIKHLIGKSYDLLEAYLNTLPVEKRYDLVYNFRYMYSVNNDKYIDLLEKYEPNDHAKISKFDLQWYLKKFDLKLSKNIMTKHKKRVLENPSFFVRRIDDMTFDKYITIDDAKKLAVAFLPASSLEFWDMSYYSRHKFFLKLIPHEETYLFLKKIFNDRYPEEEFEMSHEFAVQEYHLFMTAKVREEWAFRHLKLNKECSNSIACYYGFYEYTNFHTSFQALNNLILDTTDPYFQADMCRVLIRSARNNRELETLFNYYNEKQTESWEQKETFLHLVMSETNWFEYDEGCWNAFCNLLQDMELYNRDNIYKIVKLLYHILNKREDIINKEFVEFLSDDFSYLMINIDRYGYYNKLSVENRNCIFDYLLKYYVKRISECRDQTFTSTVSSRLKRDFNNVSGLIRIFKEECKIEDEIKVEAKCTVYALPTVRCKCDHRQIFCRYMNNDNSLVERELMRRLKKDTNLVIADDFLKKIRRRFENYHPIMISRFLKKVKIYFAHDDVSQTYLNFFADLVAKNVEEKYIDAQVFTIFQIGDEMTKIKLLDKYVPYIGQEKVQEDNRIRRKKNIFLPEVAFVKAIRSFAHLSRPPLPSSYIQKYAPQKCLKDLPPDETMLIK